MRQEGQDARDAAEVVKALTALRARAEEDDYTGILLVVVGRDANGVKMATHIAGGIDSAKAVFACEMLKREILERCDQDCRTEQLYEEGLST